MGQRQVSVETTLCISTLELKTSINVVEHFNINVNNVRQRQSNVVIFNVEFYMLSFSMSENTCKAAKIKIMNDFALQEHYLNCFNL